MKVLHYSQDSSSFALGEIEETFETFRGTVHDLANFQWPKEEVVIHDIPLFLDLLSRRNSKFAAADITPSIDLKEAILLAIGKPRSLFKKLKPWTLEGVLQGGAFGSPAAKALPTPDTAPTDLLAQCWCLGAAFGATKRKLEQENNWSRFKELEVPTHQLMLRSQITGIKVSTDRVREHLRGLDRSIARHRRTLRFGSQKHPNPRSQPTPPEDVNTAEVETELRRTEKHRRSMIQVVAYGGERIHPRATTFGTVTGRIIVRQPPIQFLKKSLRDILLPDAGNVFIYPDFDSFEPSIAAHFCGDKQLRQDLQGGCLYEVVNERILGGVLDRKAAKTFFIACCNGIQEEGMRLFLESEGLDVSQAKAGIEALKSRYGHLFEWLDDVAAEGILQGYARTLFGSPRYWPKGSGNAAKWAINQTIQGTASVILKDVMLRINRNTAYRIVLPMHDACLIEVPESEASTAVTKVEECFLEGFREWCPNGPVRISLESFC